MDLKGKNYVRLEYTEGSSSKFWELKFIGGKGIHGNDYEARWGKIGTSGQSMTYDFLTAQKKLIEKIAKGYKVKDKYEKREGTAFIYEEESGPKINFMKELEKI
jgi:predicted DNA-binding WGR domain protein